MFAQYAAIGVGHDTMHSRGHAHEFDDDHLATDSEKDGIKLFKDPSLSHVSQNDGDIEDEGNKGDKGDKENKGDKGDKGGNRDEDSNSSISDYSADSTFKTIF